MTKTEINDIFGEFEINEDYMTPGTSLHVVQPALIHSSFASDSEPGSHKNPGIQIFQIYEQGSGAKEKQHKTGNTVVCLVYLLPFVYPIVVVGYIWYIWHIW